MNYHSTAPEATLKYATLVNMEVTVQEKSRGRISVRIVRSMDEMVQALAIRAAVFVGEMGWSFADEWDGNDFSATHLIACVDGEPAGTMRIRYFADFAKPERVAVLQRHRMKRYGERGVAVALGTYARDLCRKKGYTCLYFHAYSHLQSFYDKISGDVAEPSGPAIYYGDDPHPIIPMTARYERVEGGITLDSPDHVIGRAEGDWDVPSVHERTAGARDRDRSAACTAPAAPRRRRRHLATTKAA